MEDYQLEVGRQVRCLQSIVTFDYILKSKYMGLASQITKEYYIVVQKTHI